MAINVVSSVYRQYNGGLLPDMILLTQCYYHCHEEVSSLQPMIPPKRSDVFSPCLIFLQTPMFTVGKEHKYSSSTSLVGNSLRFFDRNLAPGEDCGFSTEILTFEHTVLLYCTALSRNTRGQKFGVRLSV